MTDHLNIESSFLYQLSQDQGIAMFKFVILVGSFQDSYAPYDSARI